MQLKVPTTLDQYCKNKQDIIRKDTLPPVSMFMWNTDYNKSVIAEYFSWPAYLQMYNDVVKIVNCPDRHKIVDSTDKNSCLRYISFNVDNDNLTAIFHYRSQNQLMRLYDLQYAKAVVNCFLENSNTEYKLKIIAFVVDEFLTVKDA